MSFTAADFQPRVDDGTWDLPPPVTDPADVLRVKPYAVQPDAKPYTPPASANAGTLAITPAATTPTPANSNAATLGAQPASTATQLAVAKPPPQPPLVAPLQGDQQRRMIPWEQARLMIQRGEGTEGDKNIWNYRHAERPDYYTAGGPYQIVDSTWRQGAEWAGIDVSQWQHAIDAPKEVQEKVAHALYDRLGFQPWTKQAGGSLNPDGSVASPGSSGGQMPSFEEYQRRALAGLPPPYDPSGDIERMRLLNEQQRVAQQPIIDATLKRMRDDQEEADRQYGDLKHDLDDPALKPWTQKPPPPDPIGGLASLGSVFAALASRYSHTPGIAAMNGMAAAIEARDAGNQKQYEQAFQAYQYNAKLALERNEIVQKRYDAAWKRLTEDPVLGEAELKSIAQIYGDEKSEVLFESGQYEKAWELNRQRIETATKMAQEQQKLDQFNMFGPTAGTPERQVYEARWRDLVRQGWEQGAAKDQANRESIERVRASKPRTTAQIADAEADTLATEQWTQDHAGVAPTEAEKQSAEFIRDKQVAKVKKPNLNPKEADVQALAMAAFRQKEGRNPTTSDADAAEMATLRTQQRQEAAGVISDEAAEIIADRVLNGDERATTGMARNTVNISKVNNAIVKLAKERGLGGGDIADRIAQFTGKLQAERTLGARTVNMEIPANEAAYMIPLARDASKAVDRTEYPTLNDVLIAAERGTGGTEVVQFALAVNSLIYTYSKFLNPTGIPTDADKARATDILSTGWSQNQFEAALTQIQREIAQGRKAVTQTRQELSSGLTTPAAQPGAPAPAGAAPAGGGGAVPVIGANGEGYDAVPSGGRYRLQGDDPNGAWRVKP